MLLAPRVKVVVRCERRGENVSGGRLYATTRGEADGAAHACVRVVATDSLSGGLHGIEEAVDLVDERTTRTIPQMHEGHNDGQYQLIKSHEKQSMWGESQGGDGAHTVFSTIRCQNSGSKSE